MSTRWRSSTALPGTRSSSAGSATRAGLTGASAVVVISESAVMGKSVLQAAVERLALVEVGADAVVEHAESRADRHVHVQVLVGTQPAAEEHAALRGLLAGQLAVALELLPVLGGVDGVVRLVAGLREAGGLAHDDGLVLGVLALGVEVPELVDPGERHVLVGVVHDRGALEVADRQHLGLEVQRAPAQLTGLVVEVLEVRAGEDPGHVL